MSFSLYSVDYRCMRTNHVCGIPLQESNTLSLLRMFRCPFADDQVILLAFIAFHVPFVFSLPMKEACKFTTWNCVCPYRVAAVFPFFPKLNLSCCVCFSMSAPPSCLIFPSIAPLCRLCRVVLNTFFEVLPVARLCASSPKF
jgi:hypothetical protein